MKIKNIKRGALTIMAVTALTFSCKDSFLDVEPTGSLSETQLLSPAGLEGSLIGAYSMLNGKGFDRQSGPNNWMGQMLGGVSNKGTDPGDGAVYNAIQRFEGNSATSNFENLWKAKFEGIARANSTIKLAIASDQITDATRTRIIAEARTLRGHYYFGLKMWFDSVPYIDETVADEDIPSIPNTPDVWGNIEADFKFGMDNLDETQSDVGRVNKWAAASYLAKTYLYQQKYTEAKALLDNIMSSGQTSNGLKYQLLDEFPQIFNAENDNHAEAVWAVQSSNQTGSTNNANWFDDLNYPYNTGADGPGNCCGFNQPSFTMANMYRTSSGLPLLDESFNSAANEVKNDYGVESADAFTEDAGPLDPRIDFTIGRRGIPYLDWIEHPGKKWIRNQPYAGPYSPKKFVYYKTQENSFTDGSSWTRGYATMNVPIIRYADVVLWAAECEIALGNLDKGREYINMVRARVANPDTWVMEYDGSGPAANYQIELYDSFSGDAEAWKALKMERVLELAQEGHRFWDLVRWGDIDHFMNDIYFPHEGKILVTMFGGAKFTANKNEILPIPRTQIDIQPALKQNPNYN
ncbi:RagB/SusD family nutrient uptake outer membrane protein [Marinilongibacter aquaticus]|uniref:RagB/SusD family nutrient uptake outer membrane protein n=1 Tax=Marinilongibacter aquaticus TaxID=2975157 RepID=UPI0021BD2C14|nr:RagB/SusD family nutrient uptake outer membrane protein [Marinilongibacter aquaticus]UBM60509.1 RagB/SusD family nutrient uptake outer membrane protein [Marinilongibacter aquaticus]